LRAGLLLAGKKGKEGGSMRMKKFWRTIVIVGFLAFMIIPLIATLAFSFSTRWDHTILPEGLTLEWWKAAVSRGAFRLTLKNSFYISFATAICLAVLVTPTAYWAHLRLPKSKVIFEIMSALSFGIPGVILALALIRFYSGVPLPLVNTTNILLLACMELSFPFMYRPVANALDSVDIKTFTEASQSLGGNWLKTLIQVILPNIMPGVLNGFLLVFSTVFAEFTLTNLLVGARFKTFPIYLVEFTRFDGRQASALAIISFFMAWIVALLILWITGKKAMSSSGPVSGH
jgi:putative spermidine/putrescine transport system permease protein